MKKYYKIERKRHNDEMDFWYSGPEMQFVSREYARGYLACEASYYPGYYDLRVREVDSGEIIMEHKANGEIKANSK